MRHASPSPAPTTRLARPPVTTALVAAAVVLGLAAGACSSSSGPGPDSTSTTAAATTSAQPTPPKVPISIPASTDGTSPDGSGCTPATGTTSLPDGIWFGVLKSVDASANTIGLDLACWFSGTAAQAASGSATPVDDDYYVRNENPKIYVLPTATKVAVVPLAENAQGGLSGGPAPATTGVASAQTILNSQTPRYVWVQITEGLVTVIQAQFTP